MATDRNRRSTDSRLPKQRSEMIARQAGGGPLHGLLFHSARERQ